MDTDKLNLVNLVRMVKVMDGWIFFQIVQKDKSWDLQKVTKPLLNKLLH